MEIKLRGGGWEKLRICFPVANNFSGEERRGGEPSQKRQQQQGKFVSVQWVEMVVAVLLRTVFEEEGRSPMSHRAQLSLGQEIGRWKRKPTFPIL